MGLGELIGALNTEVPFRITGANWDTRDGSAIRDDVINFGSGRGTTVCELVTTFEEVVGRPLKTAPVPGDMPGCYASGDKAARLLNWRARLSVADGIRHSLA